MRWWYCLGVLAAAAAAVARGDGGDPDPIRDRLERARAAYRDEVGKARRAALAYLDRLEAQARRAGSKEAIDRLAVERELTEGAVRFPDALPAADRRRLDAARLATEAAYAQSVKDYTRARQDVAATRAEAELEVFRVSAPHGGRVKVVNRHSGKIVAVADGSTADGSPTIQFDYTAGKDQHWRLVPVAEGRFLLRNDQSGTLLTANPADQPGTPIRKRQDGPAAKEQEWEAVPAGKGWFLLRNRATGLCLTVDGASKGNAARLDGAERHGASGTPEQQWRFERVGG
jgi:hypothetical protein